MSLDGRISEAVVAPVVGSVRASSARRDHTFAGGLRFHRRSPHHAHDWSDFSSRGWHSSPHRKNQYPPPEQWFVALISACRYPKVGRRPLSIVNSHFWN